MNIKKIFSSIIFTVIFSTASVLISAYNNIAFAAEFRQGIYLTQTTAQNTRYVQYLIDRSKKAGINTFVIDMQDLQNLRNYQNNVSLVKQNNIRYVARIVVFKDGGTNDEVLSQDYWEKKYTLVQKAIDFGADEIQLDYIRYAPTQPPSVQNAQNIYRVIKWFKTKLDEVGIPLEIDVFGVTSFGDSLYIGQSLTLFYDAIDAICPMVYPSHYEPYQKYAKMPYYIVRVSLASIREQFHGNIPFKVYPFIELYNYRYPLSYESKIKYISAEIKAVRDSRMDGWYAWNPHNQYDILFSLLENSEQPNASEQSSSEVK
jgi:hypothetical protein